MLIFVVQIPRAKKVSQRFGPNVKMTCLSYSYSGPVSGTWYIPSWTNFSVLGGNQFHMKNSILPRKVFNQLAEHCDMFQRFSPHCIDEIGHFQRALLWEKNLEPYPPP